jgi:hypothetical protein
MTIKEDKIIIDINKEELIDKDHIIKKYEGYIVSRDDSKGINKYYLVGSDMIIELPVEHFQSFIQNIGMINIRLKNISSQLYHAKLKISRLAKQLSNLLKGKHNAKS